MTDSDLSRADDATIDRRKLLKIGAWAAPVVVLAAAVPAASASTAVSLVVPPTITPAVEGNKVTAALDVDTTQAVSVTAVMLVVQKSGKKRGEWQDSLPQADSRTDVETTAGPGTLHFSFPTYKKADANDKYTFTITFTWGTPTNTVVASGSF